MPVSSKRPSSAPRRFELPQAAIVGFGSIDREHQALFDALNAIASEFEDSDAAAGAPVAPHVAHLRDQMAMHFEHEETEMAAVRYGGTESHAMHHAAILARLDAFHATVQSLPVITADIIFELLDRLLDDVLRADLAFKDFLVGQGLANSRG